VSQPALGDGRRLRTDAARNRERIVAAARRTFAEQGIDVPMAKIAERAGVGVGTLYRRFPTRDDLLSATFLAKMTEYADLVEEALAESDPWVGFAGYLHRVCRMQADDHGFADILTMTFPRDKAFEAQRRRTFDGLVMLVARAKDAGQIREDVTTEDVVITLMANAGVISATRNAGSGAWERFAALMISSFRAANTTPAPPPPDPRVMHRALVRLRRGAR
jgi:AcrR family transcriptional regulator